MSYRKYLDKHTEEAADRYAKVSREFLSRVDVNYNNAREVAIYRIMLDGVHSVILEANEADLKVAKLKTSMAEFIDTGHVYFKGDTDASR